MVDVVHGFEGVVFEDFLPNFVPEIFLRVQLRGIRWEEVERDIGDGCTTMTFAERMMPATGAMSRMKLKLRLS